MITPDEIREKRKLLHRAIAYLDPRIEDWLVESQGSSVYIVLPHPFTMIVNDVMDAYIKVRMESHQEIRQQV